MTDSFDLPSTCRTTLELIDAFVDGELSADDRSAIEQHTAQCADCRLQLEEVLAIDRKLRSALANDHTAKAEALAQRLQPTDANRVAGKARSKSRPWISWIACVAAAAAIILLAKPPNPATERTSPIETRRVAGQLVAATSEVRYRASTGDWQLLDPSRKIDLTRGGRLRTGQASCEIRLPKNAAVRLHQGSELVLHDGDRVQLVQGQLWARGPDQGDLLVEVPSRGADEPQEISMTCPSSSELNCQVQEAQTSLSASAKVEMRSGTTSWDVLPGQTVKFDRDLKSPAVFTSTGVEQEKSWQIPLLHMQGDEARDELNRLLESVLSKIGFTKASYLYESQIRALGPPGAPPLLAYARSPESRQKPEVRRRAAQLGAELADETMIKALLPLSFDEDREVQAAALRALERLVDQSETKRPSN